MEELASVRDFFCRRQSEVYGRVEDAFIESVLTENPANDQIMNSKSEDNSGGGDESQCNSNEISPMRRIYAPPTYVIRITFLVIFSNPFNDPV